MLVLVGLRDVLLSVPPGMVVLVDGHKGEIVVNPDQSLLDEIIVRENIEKSEQRTARAAAQALGVNAERKRFEIVAIIVGVEDAPLETKNGAEGVGLFRTEFLYLDWQSLPTESKQIEAYQQVFLYYKGMLFVVRTLDIVSDKVIPYLD